MKMHAREGMANDTSSRNVLLVLDHVYLRHLQSRVDQYPPALYQPLIDILVDTLSTFQLILF